MRRHAQVESLAAQFARLQWEHQRLLQEHAVLKRSPFSAAEHRDHRQAIERHLTELVAFRRQLRTGGEDT